MWKNLVLLAIISLTFVFEGFSQQFPSEIWHNGKAAFTDNSLLQGRIKYDLDNNLIQVEVDGTIKTYTAQSVVSFEIFDEYYGGIRVFYSIPYAISGNYQAPIFFEVLTEGKEISLLCREYLTTDYQNGRMDYYGWGPTIGSRRLMFDYYFVRDNQIEKYSTKKKDLYEVVEDRLPEIKDFMKKAKLSHDKRGDLLRIIAQYNKLKSV